MNETIEAMDEASMIEAGRRFAEGLRPGDVLSLAGDLGAGKTHFCKGLAAGLDSDDPVTSPTFSLVQEYRSGRLTLYHFDWYRLESPAELDSLGWDDYLEEDGVVVVEWGDKFESMLPADTVRIHFEVADDGRRRLTVTRP